MPAYSFEVKTLRNKRWMLDQVFESETLALKRARELVKANQSEGVEVIRERQQANGAYVETVIFKEMTSGPANAAIQIVPITEAAHCRSLEEAYGLESRLTLWKVLRKYCEHVGLSPIEILHSYGALSKLMDNDPPVYPSAIDRIASLQAQVHGLDAKERREELFAWADQIGARAREAEREKSLHALSLSDFPKLLAGCTEEGGPARRDFLARCMIARQFYTERNFMAKLEMLLQAVTPSLAAEDLAILDSFVADMLGSATVIQDLLGTRTNLCNALLAMVDLMEGKDEENPPRDMPELVVVLRRLMSENRLPSGAQVLLDRVKTQILSKQPLNRANPDKENEAFGKLLARVTSVRGVMGGADMAEALTYRSAMQIPEGGAVGRRKAVSEILRLMRDPLQKLRYLLSLSQSQTGEEVLDTIMGAMDFMIAQAAEVHDLVSPRLSPPQKMMMLTELQKAILSAHIPTEARGKLVDQIDSMLALFVESDGFINRLDDENLGLRERASRLVKFCSSGILLEGRALQVVRRRVTEHLRRPNFVEHLTENCGSARESEMVLRDFHRQLAEAGFSQ